MPTRVDFSELLRRRADPLIALGLAAGYVVLLLSTSRDLGYARDEGFYFAAAESYERWFELLFREGRSALEQAAVDRYWAANHEHPALMKTLFALSHRWLYGAWHWFDEPGTAFRFPGMVVSSLGVAVTYLWSRPAVGRLAALVSAALLGFMPRVFYHSHLACFDMPVAALWLCTSYAYARSLERGSPAWVLGSGVLYGLLLDTKHNAWLLPLALVPHALLVSRDRLRAGLAAGALRLPASLLAMLVVGPLVFYAGWPWIWSDTAARLAEYVQFHLGHEYYNMEFLGRTYWKPPMPRLYAPVMTVATVPFVTLALGLAGAWLTLGRPLLARARRLAAVTTHAFPVNESLWLLCILVSYAPWLSSDTPIFGGTKHWITAYPFLCLFAGRAFASLLSGAVELGRLGERRPAVRALVPAVLALSVVIGPVCMTLRAHPWALSAYTPIVGGAPGAASLGLNRTFWGYTTGAVTDYLNEVTPPRGSVFVHDTALPSWEMAIRDGRLRRDLRASSTIAGTDVALYHHEPHMGKVESQIWVDYGTVAPSKVVAYEGVPVIWLYRRPSPR